LFNDKNNIFNLPNPSFPPSANALTVDEIGLHNNVNQFTNNRQVVLTSMILIGAGRQVQ
jgi:hypothetical protein